MSFADKVVLTDKLPVCGPEQTHGYYGFLTTGMELLAGDAGILDHLGIHHVFQRRRPPRTRRRSRRRQASMRRDVRPAGATRTLTFTKDQLSAYTDAAGNVCSSRSTCPAEDPAPETARPA